MTSPTPSGPILAKRRPYIFLGIGVGALLLSVGTYALVTANEQETDDAQIESDVVPLAVRVGGLVTHVRVADNQPVHAGDVILELDEAELHAKVAQSEAELKIAEAQATAASAQVLVVEASAKGGLQSARALFQGSSMAVTGAEAQIAASRAALLRAQAEVHKAQLDLERARALRAANAVPQERLENAQIAYDESQAQLEQATANLAAAQESKSVAISRVAEAQGRLGQSTPIEAQIAAAHAAVALAVANVQAAQAKLDVARLQFSYLKLAAPVDGVVSRLGAHEGLLLQPGQAVAELVPRDFYMVANFKETQVGRMKPGQAARVHLDAFPGLLLHGKVESLSGGTGARFSLLPPDNASGNFVKVVQRVPVRIQLDNLPADLTLRAGLSADVTVAVKE